MISPGQASVSAFYLAQKVNVNVSFAPLDERQLDVIMAMQGKPFTTSLGNKLLFPGDPSSPAKEVINCHCVLVPDVLLPVEILETLNFPGDSGTIRADLQRLAEKAIAKQKSSSLKKAIVNYTLRIAEHQQKIQGEVIMMSEETIKFIISRVIDNANNALQEAKGNMDDEYHNGKKLAYYEILDTIKNELIANDQDLEEFGLNINLEKAFL